MFSYGSLYGTSCRSGLLCLVALGTVGTSSWILLRYRAVIFRTPGCREEIAIWNTLYIYTLFSLFPIAVQQWSSTYDFRVCVGRTRDAVVEFAIDKGASWAWWDIVTNCCPCVTLSTRGAISTSNWILLKLRYSSNWWYIKTHGIKKEYLPAYNIWICIVKIVFEISMSMSLMCIFSLQWSSTYDFRVCVGRTRDAVVEFAIDKGASWAWWDISTNCCPCVTLSTRGAISTGSSWRLYIIIHRQIQQSSGQVFLNIYIATETMLTGFAKRISWALLTLLSRSGSSSWTFYSSLKEVKLDPMIAILDSNILTPPCVNSLPTLAFPPNWGSCILAVLLRTRICASLGLRMKFKTLDYPVFGRNKNTALPSFRLYCMYKQLLAPGGWLSWVCSSYYYVTIRPWGIPDAGYKCL